MTPAFVPEGLHEGSQLVYVMNRILRTSHSGRLWLMAETDPNSREAIREDCRRRRFYLLEFGPMATSLLKWKHAALAAIVFACAVQAFGRAPSDFREKQVKALMTGKAFGLRVTDADPRTVKLAKMWTSIAAEEFFKARVKVSEEAALVLSDFIYDGANNFVDQDDADEQKAEANLRGLVVTLINAVRERKGGLTAGVSPPELIFKSSDDLKATFCPLWPFC
jgi:hypothetical protein